jgi:type II secretory pathway component GspD/PulD (secretin)
VNVGPDGVARCLFQPEFRDASWLKQQLGLHRLNGLGVELVTPIVQPDKPPRARKAPPPEPLRLLLRGTPAAVGQARALLARLDRAPRAVFVSILVSEVTCRARDDSGGSVIFDQALGANPNPTFFRAFDTSFEPDDWLRATLTGAAPFQGTSLRLGDGNVGGGAFEATLRALARRGEAEFLAWPSLLVNEGEEGKVESLEQVPQMLLSDSRAGAPVVRTITEQTGLKLKVHPVHVGRESAVLDLDVWLRLPEEITDGSAPFGTLRLRRRQVTTRLKVRDREPILLGGIILRRMDRRRRGLPRPRGLSLLDPLDSARLRDQGDTEILFLVRARIVSPKRHPPEMDPAAYRAWTEVGPRAPARGLPGPWREARDPTRGGPAPGR